MSQVNKQKGVAQIFVLLILLAGIFVGVYLVQHRTNILPKAQEASYVQIVDKDGNLITETDDPNVYLKITLPPGWQLPAEKPTSGLVKEVSAQECPTSGEGTTDTFGSLTYDRCVDNAGGSNQDNSLCKGGGTKFRCFWSGAETGCISGKDINDFNYDCPTTNSNTMKPDSVLCEPNVLDYVNCRRCVTDGSSWGQEGSDYGPNSGSGEWCNCAKKYSTDFTTNPAYSACQKSKVSILDKLVIVQIVGRYSAGNGSRDLMVTSNFSEYLNKPIPWVLEALPSYAEKDKRKVFVKFVSYYQDDKLKKAKVVENEISSEVEILFKNPNYQPPAQPPAGSLRDIPVYGFVHFSLDYLQDTPSWFKNTIEQNINNAFNRIGIKIKLKVEQIDRYNEANCPRIDYNVSGDCPFVQGAQRIYAWLYKNGYRDDFPEGGIAFPLRGHIGINIPTFSYLQPLAQEDKNLLTHEIGHIFGMPDYYLEDVRYDRNYAAYIGIGAYIQDIMHSFRFYNDFDPVLGNGFAKRVSEIPITFYQMVISPYLLTPNEIILEIRDLQTRKSLPGVLVEIFPQMWDYEKKFLYIPADPLYSLITDSKGQVNFGNYYKFIPADKRGFRGFSAFLRIIKDGDVRYTAITRSYLNWRFFSGETDKSFSTIYFQDLESIPSSKKRLSAPVRRLQEIPELPEQDQKVLDEAIKQAVELQLQLIEEHNLDTTSQ